MELKNQTILITGATSGIGEALTHALSARGNRIIAVGRNQERLKALEQSLPNVTARACELTDRAKVTALADALAKDGLQVSVLINNAAIQNTPCFTEPEFDIAAIEPEVITNLVAPAWLVALLLPSLGRAAHGGAIVNLSSGLALYPKSGSAIYCATKAAIRSLSWSLRYQLGGAGISVHEVLLPLVDTPMTTGRGRGKLSPRFVAEQIITGVEQGRAELWLGKAKWLPLLNRISPAFTRRLMRKL